VDKRRASTFFTAKLVNPLVRAAARLGVPLPMVVILETRGRRSGKPRRIPVGKALEGDTLWIVAEHGHRAAYVRNIEAHPQVRIKLGRRWHSGTARPLNEDDPRARLRQIARPRRRSILNPWVVRVMGPTCSPLRVDLETG